MTHTAKPDSFCVVCGKPAVAPRGNWNKKRVTLCASADCRRIRKTALRRESRRQLSLKLDLPKPFGFAVKFPADGSDGKAAGGSPIGVAASKTVSAGAKESSGAPNRPGKRRGTQDPLWPSS
jgi:hypothetical protein